MIYLNEYYAAEKIAENTYRIDECGVVNCYLLIGEKKALLIDTGCGAGNLKEAVELLTDKPVTVAVTHRHPDHVGGAWQFDGYYVHKGDCKKIYGFLSLPVISRCMLRILKVKPGMKLHLKCGRMYRILDGHIFQLGNRKIVVRSAPGHTFGSVLFLDEKEKLMFTGDNTNLCLWMHLPGCAGLNIWLESAKQILLYADMGYKVYGGHIKKEQSKEELGRLYHCVKKAEWKNKRQKEQIKIITEHGVPVLLYRRAGR